MRIADTDFKTIENQVVKIVRHQNPYTNYRGGDYESFEDDYKTAKLEYNRLKEKKRVFCLKDEDLNLDFFATKFFFLAHASAQYDSHLRCQNFQVKTRYFQDSVPTHHHTTQM